MNIFGLPQALTGNELVTIQQIQDGRTALCTMPLSVFATFIGSSTAWALSLETTPPSTPGVVWNNEGVVSISR